MSRNVLRTIFAFRTLRAVGFLLARDSLVSPFPNVVDVHGSYLLARPVTSDFLVDLIFVFFTFCLLAWYLIPCRSPNTKSQVAMQFIPPVSHIASTARSLILQSHTSQGLSISHRRRGWLLELACLGLYRTGAEWVIFSHSDSQAFGKFGKVQAGLFLGLNVANKDRWELMMLYCGNDI